MKCKVSDVSNSFISNLYVSRIFPSSIPFEYLPWGHCAQVIPLGTFTWYSELFKVPLSKINVEFYIVKRKVLDFDDENIKSPHQAYRVQNFKPVDNRLRFS